MGEVFTYAGTHLTLVRDGSVEVTQCAELGQVGTGRFAIDDTAGTLAIVGQKDFSYTQSSCSRPLVFRGYIADRSYGRDSGIERAPHVGAGRGIGVELQDTNACLGFRLIDASDGNRPSETVTARTAWLLASDYLSGLVIDNGRVSASAEVMDKADYRNQYPGDVVADLAQAALGFNYHVNDYGSGPELVFRNDNTQTADSSTLRISNVLSDASGVTLHPFKDATLSRRPGGVHSKRAEAYAKGTVYAELATTATTFNGERGVVGSSANVKTAAAALLRAEYELGQHSTEEDVIECTVLATDVQVNLMPPGWRIQGKFSHLNTEGYGSFTWFQILEVTKKPIVADGGLYEVRLKLAPQEAAPAPEVCDDLYPPTPPGTYYPLGGSGNIPNVSDGVVFYWRAGFTYPYAGGTGLQGSWHFPLYSAGGLGNIDYFGDCAQNRLIFVTIGNGTIAVQTEVASGGVRAVALYRHNLIVAAGVSGDLLTYEVDDRTDGDCIAIIEVRDTSWPTCGGKVGWSEMVWS